VKSDYAIVTARSPRVVVLLPDLDGPDGPRADADLDRTLEWFGRVWGGAYMICLPSRTGGVSTVFRRLAAAYDPDLVLPWQPTLGSIALADLNAAENLVAEAKARGGSGRSALLAQLDGTAAILACTAPVRRHADPATLVSVLSTFNAELPAYANHLQAEFPAPLTSLAALGRQPAVDKFLSPLKPATVAAADREMIGRPTADLDLSGLDLWRRRLLKGQFGVVGGGGPGLRPTGELATLYPVDPSVDAHACATAGLTGTHPAFGGPSWADASVLASTPLERSKTGLQVWSYGRALPRPFLVVAGDSVEDYCLYLCWLRLYGEGAAAWLPDEAVPDARLDDDGSATDPWKGVFEVVRQMADDLPGHTYDGGWITSFTIDAERLGLLKIALCASYWHDVVPARFAAMPVVAPDDLPVPAAPPFYVAVGDVFERALPLLFHDDGTVGSVVRSPVPFLLSDAAKSGTDMLIGNWVADVTVARCRLPPRRRAAAAAELDTSLLDAGLVRVGRSGTAAVGVAQQNLPAELLVDHALTGLSLRDPDLSTLLGHLLQDGMAWQLSDAGRFYQGFADMAGGLAGLVDTLRDPATSAILDGFRDTARGAGRVLLADSRRYLRSVECRALVRARTNGDPVTVRGTRAVMDRLLAVGILTRGLILKCSRCRATAFQPLAAVDNRFACPRCSFSQLLTNQSWCDTPPHEPAWFYRLDELVYQALLKNVRVPALALAELGACSENARHLWSVELVCDGKRELELDFLCLVEGKLSAGEAKTNGKLSKRDATAEVGKTLTGARHTQADQVVFATTDPEWSQPMLDVVQNSVSTLDRPRALLLTALA
jgi:DNA-directed RNA polymerase subunit RPC12/RpoP